MTCVVASLPVRSIAELNERMKRLRDTDLIELRLDYMHELPPVDEFIKKVEDFRDKIIVTVRDVNEGGVNKISESSKADFLKELYKEGIIYDVEVRFLKRNIVPYENVIVSIHYFDCLPTFEEVRNNLSSYANRALVKLAVIGTGKYKQLLARVLEEFPNSAVMPMGVNPLERIAFSILGSKLIYAHAGEDTAKGQMYYKDVKNILSYFNVECEKLFPNPRR